jgi:hypothetical protein
MKGLTHFTNTVRGQSSNYATLYNVAGVGSVTAGSAYNYTDSFAMSEDELDKELEKFKNVANVTPTDIKKTKVKKSKKA